MSNKKVIYVSIPVAVDLIETINPQPLKDNQYVNSFVVLKHGFPGLSVKETKEELEQKIKEAENAK